MNRDYLHQHHLGIRNHRPYFAYPSLPHKMTSALSQADKARESAERIIPSTTTRDSRYMVGGSGAGLVHYNHEDPYPNKTSHVIMTSHNWQDRGPSEDGKDTFDAPRNPSTPPKSARLSKHHERKLSEQFFDATKLNKDSDPATEDSGSDRESGKKHRRMFSGDGTNPPVAHRRIDSKGFSANVDRMTGRPRRHHRVESEGLDMLSAAAAVDISKEEFAAVAAHQHAPMGHRPYVNHYHQGYDGAMHHSPPPLPPTTHYNHHYPHPSHYYLHYQGRPGAPYQYPPREAESHQYGSTAAWGAPPANPPPTHHQTTSQPCVPSAPTGNTSLAPSESGAHHRKLSSISLGALFAPGLFGGPGDSQSSLQHPLKGGHHRSTSSSVSFLENLGDVDDAFLRNLDAGAASELGMVSKPQAPAPVLSTKSASPPQAEKPAETKLAAGGTSKRVRRKCTMDGCTNRVVQGGLCIAHGAKRKVCNHPGCTKNVKKAGMCSAHGPARKRCEHEGCHKVAVQGGRCISHGAKKRACSMDGCTKQAILGGMCKKHHDKAFADGTLADDKDLVCKEVKESGHSRGLSIFQEISADAIKSILSDDQKGKDQTPRVWQA